MRFDEFTRDPEATEALLSNMMRNSDRYELDCGFVRSSSRARHALPRVSAFAANVPTSRTDLAWFLYDLFQDRLAAQHLVAQTHRILVSCPDADAVRGSLYNSGFAFRYAVRAQALLRLLVSVWLLPTASQKKAMLMEAFVAGSDGAPGADDSRVCGKPVVRLAGMGCDVGV